MRAVPAGAVLSSELLWWELLLDASQCWGNRLKKSFWESCNSALGPVKNDAVLCRQAQAISSAARSVDNGENAAENISRVSDGVLTTAFGRLRKLFPEAHEGPRNACGSVGAIIQEGSIKAGAKLNVLASGASTDLYFRSGAREGLNPLPWVSWDAMLAGQARLGNGFLAVELFEKMQQEGLRLNKSTLLSMLKACTDAQGLERDTVVCSLGESAAGCDQSNSVIESAFVLESAFKEMYVKHRGLEEAKYVLENIQSQLLSWNMNSAGNTLSGSNYLRLLLDKASAFHGLDLFKRMEQEVKRPNDDIYFSISTAYGGTGLARLGRCLHNHVISTELKIDMCFWSALIDLYAKCGMLEDAYDVLKRLGNSLAVPSDALTTAYALPGECSGDMPQDGENSDDRVNTSFLAWSHRGHVVEGHHAFKVLADSALKPHTKHFMNWASLSGSSGCLKQTHGIGLSLSSIMFGRAMSTSTEKQLDEDAGEQQSSIQQSSTQQQSSLEIPQSKPEGGSSWPNPDNAASYVLMSNIYADGDRWDEVKRINEMRLKARAWKKPGKAYVEIKAKVHEFIVGDRTHQDSTNIYEKLRKIKRHMGHIGYVPNVDLILENRSYYDPYKPR